MGLIRAARIGIIGVNCKMKRFLPRWRFFIELR